MIHHPYVIEAVTRERRNDILQEAANRRLVRQAQSQRSARPNILKRIVVILVGSLNEPGAKVADQGHFSTDRALPHGYH